MSVESFSEGQLQTYLSFWSGRNKFGLISQLKLLLISVITGLVCYHFTKIPKVFSLAIHRNIDLCLLIFYILLYPKYLCQCEGE